MLLGWDNVAFEHLPADDEHTWLPVHMYLFNKHRPHHHRGRQLRGTSRRARLRVRLLRFPPEAAERLRLADPLCGDAAPVLMVELSANLARMEETLGRLSSPEVGSTTGRGVSRPALSDADREVRLLFQRMMGYLGLAARFDDMGSTYGRRPGMDDVLSPVLVGSHLDTVVPGGRFDGILGVTAALEAIAVLNEDDITTLRPIELVNWTGEEGARFSPAMIASVVITGVHDVEYAYSRTDQDGKRFRDELERIGFRGEASARPAEIHASFEMHIEQGTCLEAGVPVGIVTGVDSVRWFAVRVRGRGEHAGSPGPAGRRDAIRAAARMILAAR